MGKTGVKSIGIVTPFIREGDDIVKIVVDSVLDATRLGEKMRQPAHNVKGLVRIEGEYDYDINDNDVIGITESVVARSSGLYVTVDEIAMDILNKFGTNSELIIDSPIYSRNRFAMILKGIARAARKLYFVMPPFDEVGNPSGVNPFTGVDIQKYYKEICDSENCMSIFGESLYDVTKNMSDYDINNCGWIYCGLHDCKEWKEKTAGEKRVTLADICSDKNPDFGLLGCNKSTEERLKLFPTVKLSEDVCYAVKEEIKNRAGKEVHVLVYGDGCFHSPEHEGVHGSSIWEFADPVTVPGSTHGILDGSPNETKLKAIIDSSASDAEVRKMVGMNKSRKLVGKMAAMGTTPRKYTDLLASLMDLTSGSGDRATPVVLVQNYF